MPPSAAVETRRQSRAVPTKPDFSRHSADPRFDPYRDRVARLYRDGREVGLAFVNEDWLEEWGLGRFDHYGETLEAAWASNEDSEQLRQSEFGSEAD